MAEVAAFIYEDGVGDRRSPLRDELLYAFDVVPNTHVPEDHWKLRMPNIASLVRRLILELGGERDRIVRVYNCQVAVNLWEDRKVMEYSEGQPLSLHLRDEPGLHGPNHVPLHEESVGAVVVLQPCERLLKDSNGSRVHCDSFPRTKMRRVIGIALALLTCGPYSPAT